MVVVMLMWSSWCGFGRHGCHGGDGQYHHHDDRISTTTMTTASAPSR